MPDIRPIGVFDSGLGGLTAVRELHRILPGEDILYFGDTGRVPYGTRSRETIIKYVRQDMAFLASFDIKAIVVACGTAGAVALPHVNPPAGLPLFGVLEPVARACAKATHTGRVGLMGTESTIRSGAYERLLTALDPSVTVTAVACPLLVPLVENERFAPGDPLVEMVVGEYLAPLKAAGVDAVMLGCTHYPLLTPVIRAHMEGVELIDAGREVALSLADALGRADKLSGKTARGDTRYYVSDSVERFARLASIFLDAEVENGVEKIDIDNILC